MGDYSFFDDIAIPVRNNGGDVSVLFVYNAAEGFIDMEISRGKETFFYLGHSRASDGVVDVRIPSLSLIDPFLEKRSRIPTKFVKIVLRVIIPKLKASNKNIDCDCTLSNEPFAVIEITEADMKKCVCRVKWAAERSSITDAVGLDGYIRSGDNLYKGTLEDVAVAARIESEGLNIPGLERLMRSSEYMLYFRNPALRARLLSPRLPENREISISDFLSDTMVPSAPVPEKKSVMKTLPGPVLYSVSVMPKYRTTGARYVSFAHEAKRLSTFRGKKCEFVPFVCYLPTYSAMTRDQREWYFYWRGQFFDGNVLKTDLSYIFVAVFEIINKAFPSGTESYNRLISLWKAYRSDFPRLDRYMPKWCRDYIFVNNIPRGLEDIPKEIPLEPDALVPYIELYYEDKLRKGLHALPIDVLFSLASYKPRDSKLYSSGHGQEYEKSLIKALAALDRYCIDKYSHGLFEHIAPEKTRITFDSFQGAVCAHAASRRIELQLRLPSMSLSFQSVLDSIMKHVENTARSKLSVPGRLRSYTIDEDFSAVIESVIGKRIQEVPKKIDADLEEERRQAKEYASRFEQIDVSKALLLEEESWQNTERLLEYMEPDPSVAGEVAAIEDAADVSEDTFSGRDDVFDDFALSLTALEGEVLELLKSGHISAIGEKCEKEFTFPDAVYESINDKASDTLGDIIIDTAEQVIIEDYAEYFG